MPRYVGVQFDQGFSYTEKVYSFKTVIADLTPGDLVLVHCRNGLKLARVHGYTEEVKANAWVMQKVNLEKLEQKLKMQIARREGK